MPNQSRKQSGESTRRSEKQRANRVERRKPSGTGTRSDAPPGPEADDNGVLRSRALGERKHVFFL
ncbi:hypothetical protein Bca101_029207 [Brassica carinata]